MIPILYDTDESSFLSFGIGALADTVSCQVTEERNGAFELEMKYPVSGALFEELIEERIIKAKPNDTSDDQLFRIYRISTPIKGTVTIYAQHISYDLANVGETVWSSANISPALALENIMNNTATEHEFTGSTDISTAKAFAVSRPQSVRACLGGVEGSMLDIWGGEFEWDNFEVNLHRNRGSDNGVVIEYGKNMTEFEHNTDNSTVYSHVLPYAVYTDDEQAEHVVTLTEIVLPITGTELTHSKTLIKDFTDSFDAETEITEDALRGVAASYISANPLGTVMPDITVSFEPLWKMPEYAEVLEKVSLCDTVTIRHTPLGITTKTKVITTVYDTLGEKYVSITLGSPQANFINTVNGVTEAAKKAVEKVDRFPALMSAAIKNATDRITGQTGGYVILNSDNGKPYELLITDDPDISVAQNVWRWNLNGLGFSSTGYDGEYETAITSDGEIVADFITSGTLVANIIKAGVLSSLDGTSYWDIETGTVVLKAYTTTETAQNITESIDGIHNEITIINDKSAELQTSVDGINSYVATLTENVETITNELGESKEDLLSLHESISSLEQTVEGVSVKVSNRYVGGMNMVENSAGLNGISDDWVTTGTVRTDATTDTKNNTTSGSAFVLGDNSSLSQKITGLIAGTPYFFSLKTKKSGNGYLSSITLFYNEKTVGILQTASSYDWQEVTLAIDDLQDSSIEFKAFNREGELILSDILLTEGDTQKKWSPAPNEIYTNEVKIDKRGITVSNSSSSQKTVITNTEFAGYYDDEVIFTLNKDETQTKKTTVDGELTVGKTKFIPAPGNGLNIVVLD